MRISKDGLVYVCDRANDRIQVFRKDGKFVKEFRIEPATLSNGSVWDLVLSEDAAQKFIFIADGANGQIISIVRDTGEVLNQWGRHGRQPGQFKWVHNIGDRQQRQPLHRRSRLRPPRAEIPAGELRMDARGSGARA